MSRARHLALRVLGADLRALAVLRIGLGVAVLVDLAVRAGDLHAFYTDAGVLSRSDALALFGWLHAWPLCVHMAGGSFWSQVLFFLTHLGHGEVSYQRVHFVAATILPRQQTHSQETV